MFVLSQLLLLRRMAMQPVNCCVNCRLHAGLPPLGAHLCSLCVGFVLHPHGPRTCAPPGQGWGRTSANVQLSDEATSASFFRQRVVECQLALRSNGKETIPAPLTRDTCQEVTLSPPPPGLAIPPPRPCNPPPPPGDRHLA